MTHHGKQEEDNINDTLNKQDLFSAASFIKSTVPEPEINKIYSLPSPAFHIQLNNILKASYPKSNNQKIRTRLSLLISLLSLMKPLEMGRWLLSAVENMSQDFPELSRLSCIAREGGEKDLDIFTRRVYFSTAPMDKELAEEIIFFMLILGEECEEFLLWEEAKFTFERAYEITVITAGMNSKYKETSAFGVARTNYYYNQEEHKKTLAQQHADESKLFINNEKESNSEYLGPDQQSVFSLNKEKSIFPDNPDIGKRTGQIHRISQLMGFVLCLLGIWGVSNDNIESLKEVSASKFTIDTILKVTVEEPTFFSFILLSGIILILWPLIIKVRRISKVHRQQSVTVEHSTPEGETSSRSSKASRIDDHDNPD